MDWDPEKIDAAVLGLLHLTLHDGRRAWKGFDWEALGRLHGKGLIEDPVNKSKSVVLTPRGLELAEEIAKATLCTAASDTWRALKSRPPVQYRSADGVKGVLCRSAVDGKPFFRIYSGDGGFEDYELHHDDLSVQIDNHAMAALYRGAGPPVLDHSPQVLGIDDADGMQSGTR